MNRTNPLFETTTNDGPDRVGGDAFDGDAVTMIERTTSSLVDEAKRRAKAMNKGRQSHEGRRASKWGSEKKAGVVRLRWVRRRT